ncbi:hypothetical protein Ddc_19890 [Ditylenchus destructor]|nr:hypothetical protein Ddc_19890 [Ditylenchus destructor]
MMLYKSAIIGSVVIRFPNLGNSRSRRTKFQSRRTVLRSPVNGYWSVSRNARSLKEEFDSIRAANKEMINSEFKKFHSYLNRIALYFIVGSVTVVIAVKVFSDNFIIVIGTKDERRSEQENDAQKSQNM